MDTDVIPLEILFSSPYFWSPTSIKDFFLEASKFLDDSKVNQPERKSPDDNDTIYNFKNELNNSAAEENITGENGDWGAILQERDYYDILATKYVGKKATPIIYNSSLVTDLLVVIRHLNEHIRSIPSKAKEKIGFYSIPGSKTEDQVFVEFWTGLFPKLLPFLWKQFYQFGNEFQEYYPVSLDLWLERVGFEMGTVVQEIDKAFRNDLMHGSLDARYATTDTPPNSIEFRTSAFSKVNQAIKDNSTTAIIWKDRKLELWKNKWKSGMKIPINNNSSSTTENFAIIFANSANPEIDKNLLKACKDTSRIIVLGVNEQIFLQILTKVEKEFLRKYVKHPLKWEEIDSDYQKELGSRLIEFVKGGKTIELNQILQDDNARKMFLQGSALNKILRNDSVRLFTKGGFGEPLENYFDRQLVNRDQISARIFTDPDVTHEIFAVLDIDRSELIQILSETYFLEIEKLTELQNLNQEQIKKIILVKEKEIEESRIREEFETAALKFRKLGVNHDICILKYSQESYFKCVGFSQGIYSNLLTLINNNAAIIPQSEFLESIEHSKSPIFIFDEAGMGKTELCKKLCEDILFKYKSRIIVLTSMKRFLFHIDLEYNADKNIDFCKSASRKNIEVAIKRVVSASRLEDNLLDFWLNNETPDKIIFEVVFDSLDELDKHQFKLATEIINTMQNECPSIRMWIVARNTIMHKLWRKFGQLGYSFKTFSSQDQVEFLIKHWECLGTHNDLKKLETFARDCLEISTYGKYNKVTRTPLICQLIAEIIIEKVMCETETEDSSPKPNYTIIDIYEQTVEWKLKAYLTKRIGYHPDNYTLNLYRAEAYRLLTLYALNLYLPQNSKLIQKMNPFKVSEDEQHFVLELGIVTNTDPKLIEFCHNTFAEYFVAHFIYSVLSKEQYLGVDKNDLYFLQSLWTNLFGIGLTEDMGYDVKFKNVGICNFFVYLWNQNRNQQKSGFLKGPLPDYFVGMANNWIFYADEPLRLAVKNLQEKSFVNVKSKRPNLVQLTILLSQFNAFAQLTQTHLVSVEHISRQICKENGDLVDFHDIFGCIYSSVGLEMVNAAVNYSNVEKFIEVFLCENPYKNQRDKFLHAFVKRCLMASSTVYSHLLRFFVLKMKANLYSTDSNGNTILHGTVNCKNLDSRKLEHLLNNYKDTLIFTMNNVNGSIINFVNFAGETPLTSIIQCFHNVNSPVLIQKWKDLLSVFKQYEANFNFKSKCGEQPLHHAINLSFDSDIINKLIECGAEATNPGNTGWSPLHWAAWRNDVNTVKLLVDNYKVPVTTCDYNGKTALDYCKVDEVKMVLTKNDAPNGTIR